jgi:hypothetical protein
MDQIGKEDGIIDEEDWNVDANNVFCLRSIHHFNVFGQMLLTKVSFVSVEPSGEPMHISRRIYTAPLPDNSGHTSKHRRLFTCLRKERSSSNIAEIAVAREDTVGS